MAIEQAKKLETPSKAYRDMMDAFLKRVEKEEVEFSRIDDVIARNGI